MFHKKAGAGAGQTGSRSSHTEILARAASADDVHGRQLRSVQLGDVPHMAHAGEMVFGHFDGEGFDLAGPQWLYAVADRREGEAADTIEQASHSKHFSSCPHLIAVATALVVLTAACAV